MGVRGEHGATGIQGVAAEELYTYRYKNVSSDNSGKVYDISALVPSGYM